MHFCIEVSNILKSLEQYYEHMYQFNLRGWNVMLPPVKSCEYSNVCGLATLYNLTLQLLTGLIFHNVHSP